MKKMDLSAMSGNGMKLGFCRLKVGLQQKTGDLELIWNLHLDPEIADYEQYH